MRRKELTDKILEHKIIAIIRTQHGETVPSLIQALYEGGIRVMEVTYNTPGCLEFVKEYHAYNDVLMGVGTVLSAEDVARSHEAGAQFFVSPIFSEALIRESHRYDKPILCGAFSPTEIYQAYAWGSDLVKVFPANDLGPSYLKGILAPMPMLPLAPTGGIHAGNTQEWLGAGAKALGVGSGLLPKALIETRDYGAITKLAQKMVTSLS
ncbi:MAG: bifunctional 4-hydroxy-2-oxoglutarate aldolase/2-dehydro-3-deoxy-phosphogluconate aldolase [Bacteroidota bacterium]